MEKKTKKTKKNKKENSFKEFITSYKFLYSTLIILFVLVVVLGILVFRASKKAENEKVNLVVPVLSTGSNNSLKVDLNAIYEHGKYVIKVTNYRGKEVNEEETKFSMIVRNSTKNSIKIVKDNSEENLMVDQEATKIEDQKLRSKIKEETTYTFTLDENSKPEKNDLIDIEIIS